MSQMHAEIPAIGLGTFRLQGRQAIDSVTTAFELGYRHIDTAQLYDNEAEVGHAIADSGVARGDLFVTTKIWTDKLRKDKLMPSLKESLNKLRMDRVDLTLIHWPSPNDEVPMEEYMNALLEAKQQGLTRLVGISNFTVAQMRKAIDAIGADEIATNQVEIHPFLQNSKVAEFARQQGIHLTAYMPLAYGKVLQEPLLQEIAKEHGATPAQVSLAWLLQQGFSVIPSSTKREHLKSNLAARTLQLTPSDMTHIHELDRNERIASPGFAPDWD